MQKLFIHYEKKLVGTLEHNFTTNNFNFTYDSEWVKNGFELSPSLKFSGFKNNAFRLFIENLLPEGDGLESMSLYFQISKANKFALLKKIGAETTGALTFTDSQELDIPTSFREISPRELQERVEKRETESISVWDRKLRLSVTGVQEKLPLAIIAGKMGFGEGDICSTHILKFNRKNENVVFNEYISLKLAQAVGINVAEVEYKRLGKESILIVKRFDREVINSNLVKRFHIIDSVQALGYPVAFKYERVYSSSDMRDGVSFKKLFSLQKEAKVPLLFIEQLIKWNMINLCLGNSDAHGKNISFFVDKDGLEIAPFYDIVNVTMYKDKYEQDMAMAIDDEFQFDKLKVYDFLEFFKQNRINKTQYFNDFKKLTKKIQEHLTFDFIADVLKKEEISFIKNYRENLIHRINKLIDTLNEALFILPLDEDYEEFYNEYKTIITRKVKNSNSSKKESVEKYLLLIEKEMIEHICL